MVRQAHYERNTHIIMVIKPFALSLSKGSTALLCGIIDMLHSTVKQLIEIEQLLKDCPDVLLDGVERSIQRPLDYELQQECYSGKKNA